MKLIPTGFDGLWILEPVIHEDKRGYFFESYNQRTFRNAGLDFDFVQDNQSTSQKGVIRGLHFQAPPTAQVKLVRVLVGTIWDVAVDLRKGQPTYGHVYYAELSAANKRQLIVPKGFAHGFSVLSDVAEVLYKSDGLYAPDLQRGIRYNDPKLAIDWKIPGNMAPVLSEADHKWPCLDELPDYF